MAALLGAPAYYRRFDFRPAAELGITAPDPAWGPHFQARHLTGPPVGGAFRYAAPFDEPLSSAPARRRLARGEGLLRHGPVVGARVGHVGGRVPRRGRLGGRRCPPSAPARRGGRAGDRGAVGRLLVGRGAAAAAMASCTICRIRS